MPLLDPYTTLAVPKALVVEFLGVYSRCEYAFKESGYRRGDTKIATAAWQRLAGAAGGWVQAPVDSPLAAAIDYLCSDPPKVQTAQGWQPHPLPGSTPVSRAVNAAVRVRQNLFHSGKPASESTPGREHQLVDAALIVLTAVIEQAPEPLREAYGRL